jgi:hypothetical protein
MAPATHQPAPSDTQGNASRQLVVVMVFGRRVAPALWRLTFAALISWGSLSVGGSGLAVGLLPTYTCRAYDSAAVVLERPGRGRPRLEEIIKTKKITYPAPSRIQPLVGAVFEYFTQLRWAVPAVKTRDCVMELISQILGVHGDHRNPRDRDFCGRFSVIHVDFVVHCHAL